MLMPRDEAASVCNKCYVQLCSVSVAVGCHYEVLQ